MQKLASFYGHEGAPTGKYVTNPQCKWLVSRKSELTNAPVVM